MNSTKLTRHADVVLVSLIALLSFADNILVTKQLETIELKTLTPVIEHNISVPQTRGERYQGIASYYSHDGCVGCRADQLMANGKPFIEDNLTLAFNKLPLGTFVEVTNVTNGQAVTAQVTDTGGFEKLGRIADLSKGTKEAINCTDLCEVEIVHILDFKGGDSK